MKEQAVVSLCAVWPHRNFFRDLHYLHAILDVRRSKRLKTLSSAIDQKWHAAPYFPGSSNSSTPGHGSAKHVFSEKIVIAVTVTDYDVLDSAPGTEQLFAEQLALFLLLRCEFHVVYYMYSEIFQKLCHSTRKACSHAKATSKPVVASAALVPADRTHDESRAHERWGRMANPSAIDRTGEETRRVSFFPVFFGDCFTFFGRGEG